MKGSRLGLRKSFDRARQRYRGEAGRQKKKKKKKKKREREGGEWMTKEFLGSSIKVPLCGRQEPRRPAQKPKLTINHIILSVDLDGEKNYIFLSCSES